ncbi:MAG: glutamate formimidoyltransferase [Flavobacteriaceae bacterium]|jgi:glutamate formiminotransferase/formiminotetrahydrofolate cyclodeaminase|nr:glutamate formimidoyltransferase [Flavobacteriaceae bacterium]MBT3753906.1 glutamate formimidoyltransferase [Flavobacteriaceae bacterium]MBT3794188.1 glutamate formimidoyltransferase [Flavobacteriaceae bacterium]MBT4245822.1 glutamate formimidoyltransferase [Flavobacteriaceae bacterium]MBT4415780.1 glutamate formimidoyltransferase [Flavobacteriaceae bacterium]
MNQIVECVPNFSEGNDNEVLNSISAAISGSKGVSLLNVDSGKATNRTVMTFVGDPDSVVKAAFNAIKVASEKIDMSKHKGEHPRFGATDVCPLVPVANISLKELVPYAQQLAKMVAEELKIPVYLYEHAAKNNKRKNLADVRLGEYEGLQVKLLKKDWKPDFGPTIFNKKSGALAIGVRDFLIAYNINLNTKSTRLANAIAFDVREKGRIKRKGHPVIGEIVKDQKGNPKTIPGSLKNVKAIGWYIEEFGISQISMNLTNINETPVHIVFQEVIKKADKRGVRITGSEIVGLIPLKSMLDAGKYFLKKQNRSIGIPEKDIIDIAIESLGLNQVKKFTPEKNIIEYFLNSLANDKKKNIELTASEFSDEVTRESPAPGGGSVSAYVGSLGASLGAMVANLSSNKRGWENQVEMFSHIADQINVIRNELLLLVDEDSNAFNMIMLAFKLPNNSEKEKKIRLKSINESTIYAAKVPLKVMEKSYECYDLILKLAKEGNQNSISDAGVACLCVYTAIYGAYLNVKINLKDLPNDKSIIERANDILVKSSTKKRNILNYIQGII